jgi:hypothetical protein
LSLSLPLAFLYVLSEVELLCSSRTRLLKTVTSVVSSGGGEGACKCTFRRWLPDIDRPRIRKATPCWNGVDGRRRIDISFSDPTVMLSVICFDSIKAKEHFLLPYMRFASIKAICSYRCAPLRYSVVAVCGELVGGWEQGLGDHGCKQRLLNEPYQSLTDSICTSSDTQGAEGAITLLL